jgi:SulP family sulfate permease
MRHVPFIDATGMHRLKELTRQLQSRGTTIIISGANRDVKKELLQASMYKLLDKHNIHENIGHAIQRAKDILAAKEKR